MAAIVIGGRLSLQSGAKINIRKPAVLFREIFFDVQSNLSSKCLQKGLKDDKANGRPL